ncbi:hypothetical protein WL30_01160 [Burkholderia ubonensis]|nr:hypothetical protein WL30_01160 [Burkholderia ubonensis]KWB12623.1 hypothetical protein WL31_00255 [Burkholderia ubonensis]
MVQVKSIQVAYTFSGSNGPEFFQFMFNSDDGNAVVNVKPTDTALLTQIGNAITVLGQKQKVEALVEDQQLTYLVTFPS